MASICLAFASGVGPSLRSRQYFTSKTILRGVHLSIQYPIQVVLSFLRAAWSASDSPKQFRLPLLALFRPFRGFLSLSILNFRLLVSCKHVVSIFYRYSRGMP